MKLLKLVALDRQDLEIVSAHVQDAVLKVSDLVYRADARQFVLGLNRFVWEKKPGLFRGGHERRRSALHFDRVTRVRFAGIDRARPEDVLSLLAVTFDMADEPSGTVELAFSGGATIRLDVECLEAMLTDLGPAWEAGARPSHRA